MISRLFISLRRTERLGRLLSLSALLLLLITTPALAFELSIAFDSEGRPLKPAAPSAARPQYPQAGPVGPGPDGETLRDVIYEYYPVAGRTFSEILKAVRENGPYRKDRSGRQPCKVAWSTALSFQYAVSYAVDEENRKLHTAIEMSGITLEDTSTITLPSLLDDTALNPVEQSMWQTYLAGLTDYGHAIVALIRDQQARKAAGDKLAENTYFIFDYAEGMDIEKSVAAVLREEALRTGQEAAREIAARISRYEQSAAPENSRRAKKKAAGN